MFLRKQFLIWVSDCNFKCSVQEQSMCFHFTVLQAVGWSESLSACFSTSCRRAGFQLCSEVNFVHFRKCIEIIACSHHYLGSALWDCLGDEVVLARVLGNGTGSLCLWWKRIFTLWRVLCLCWEINEYFSFPIFFMKYSLVLF